MNFMKTSIVSQTEDNAQIDIAITANSGESIYITSLSCSFDGNVSDMSLWIEDGGDEVWRVNVPDDNIVQFDWTIPLKATEGNDIHVFLSASGTGGTNGTLNVAYGKGE